MLQEGLLGEEGTDIMHVVFLSAQFHSRRELLNYNW